MAHCRTLSFFFLGMILFGRTSNASAQGHLEKKLTLSTHQRPLTQTLADLGRKGGFVFSYNTTILNGDSVVDVHADKLPVRQILDQVLGPGYEYSESGKYIIILQRPNAPPDAPPIRQYTVSGYIKEEGTQEKLSNVSVYESGQLVSTLTDTNGFFRLRLRERDRFTTATVVVSKQFYRDTVLFVRSGYDREYTLNISREKVSDLTPFVVTHHVEKTWLGRLFLSSRSVVQSLNIVNYLADKPVQMSLTPGLGTHGRMGAQVVNKLSLNIIGGYTFGMNGLELAGIFNIDRKNVRYVQAAGIFNVVGGKVTGVQLAGIHNHDLDSMTGVQAAGNSNVVRGSVAGVQLGGIANVVIKDVRGVQAAGIVNVVWEKTSGFQVAGIINESRKEVDGLQVSGIVNYTKKLKGMQIGLINLADTCDGFMLGLINIVKHGVHQLSISANELLPLTISYRTGSRKIYNILELGYDPRRNEKVYSYGVGIGTERTFSSRLSMNTEGIVNSLIVGHHRDDDLPIVFRLQLPLRLKLSQTISLFGGPAFSIALANKAVTPDGYKTILPADGYHTYRIGSGTGWIGFTAGVSFF
jgi:hypothetical protein